MPEIARFYGIVIKSAKGMVEDWARLHQPELLRMWKEQRFHKLAPLE